MFAWYLSLLSIPITRLSFMWTYEIWGDEVKCSSRRAPKYFTEFVGNNLFPSSLILKELFNFVFCLRNTTSSVFSIFRESLFALSHIESFLRSWFILFANVSCKRSERVTLVSSAKWYALEYFGHGMSGGHWCRWGIIMNLEQILEALQILFPWLFRLGYQWIQTVVFPLGMSGTSQSFDSPLIP